MVTKADATITVRVEGHAQIPAWVITHPVVRANRTVLHVYAALYLAGNYREKTADVSMSALASASGLSSATVYRDMKAMRDAGIIVHEGGSQYYLPPAVPTTVGRFPTTVGEVSTTVERTLYTEQSEVSQSGHQPVASLNLVAQAGEVLPDQFDAFWTVYPRKEAKAAAKKAWAKATRSTPPEAIIAGAYRYNQDPNREPAFTAHPTTWLNAGRWDDEPLPPRRTTTDPLRGRRATSLDQSIAALNLRSDYEL